MNEPLRNRMQEWQEIPPPGVWPAISGDLQEYNAEQKLRNRFDLMEAVPPIDSWNHISKHLNGNAATETKQAQVIPIRPLAPYLFKYAAAAVVIGFVVWMFDGKFFTHPVQEITTSLVSVRSQAKTAPHQSDMMPSSSKSPLNKGVSSFNQSISELNSIEESKNIKGRPLRNATTAFPTAEQSDITPGSRSVNYNRPPEMTFRELPVQNKDRRYLTIKDEAGNTIKLSAKFAPLYYSLVSSTENNANLLIQALQQQIIRKPFSPAPDNMMDLLQLWDLMQQQQ